MPNKPISILTALYCALFLFGLVFLPHTAFAVDGSKSNQDERDLRPKILDVDLDRIESIGLIRTPKDGGLGRDLWSKSDRKEISYLLKKLPTPDPKLPAHKRLVWGALLSVTNAELIVTENEDDIETDILTIRLNKLMDFGAYKQALDMYTQINHEPYHPALAKAGLLAMLYNGEKSLACLEYKTLEDRDFNGKFWTDMNLYCRYVLEDNKEARHALKKANSSVLKKIASNSKYSVTYKRDSFKKLGPLSRAILIAEERLTKGRLDSQTIKAMPLSHLGLFLRRDDLSNSEKFYVIARAVDTGLDTSESLRDFYKEHYKKRLKDSKIEDIQGWQRLPAAYHAINNAAKGGEQWAVFNSISPLMEQYGTGAFSPFANILEDLAIKELSRSQILKAITVLHHEQIAIPRKWAEFFLKKKNKKFADKKLATLGIIATPSYRLNDNDIDIVQTLKAQNTGTLEKNINNIIENIDKRIKDAHNAPKVYENYFDLTSYDNYVMPTHSVWDRLRESGQNGQIGTTVLLSTQILRQWDADKLYPGFISDVFDNLSNVGLTNITESLTTSLVLEYAKK